MGRQGNGKKKIAKEDCAEGVKNASKKGGTLVIPSKVLLDFFKEKVLHVTARMKKIAAQIDRQLATLPQNAIPTDRQVKQILAALSS